MVSVTITQTVHLIAVKAAGTYIRINLESYRSLLTLFTMTATSLGATAMVAAEVYRRTLNSLSSRAWSHPSLSCALNSYILRSWRPSLSRESSESRWVTAVHHLGSEDLSTSILFAATFLILLTRITMAWSQSTNGLIAQFVLHPVARAVRSLSSNGQSLTMQMLDT